MSFGDYLYIIAIVVFSFMTFTIIRNNFLSKFDDKERRLDLVDEYEDEYVNTESENGSEDEDPEERKKD